MELKHEDLDGRNWRVLEDFSYQTSIKSAETITSDFFIFHGNGRIDVLKGFCWDGPTGGLDTPNTMLASLLHDIGCIMRERGQLTDEQIDQFDDLYYTICVEEGMTKFRAGIQFAAISANTKIRYGV